MRNYRKKIPNNPSNALEKLDSLNSGYKEKKTMRNSCSDNNY